MKKAIVMSLVGLVFVAQSAVAGGIGVFGAYWDTKDLDDAIGGGATLRFSLTPEVMLELAASYFEFEEDDVADGEKATFEVVPLEAGLLVKLVDEDALTLYAGGGGGYYMMEAEFTDEEGTTTIDVDGELGFYVSGGAMLKLGPSFSIFGEARYTWLSAKKGTVKFDGMEFDIDFDGDLDGFGARAGLMLTW